MNSKEIAVVICNYNKQDFVVKCIDSVFQSIIINQIDIYVVDNASTDDSVEIIKNKYGSKINLVVNDSNTGGAGGFNTGIQIATNREYKYIHLLDNDVIIDNHAISELYNLLEQNSDIAAAGSKLYSMDKPSQLQEFGSVINWSNYYISPFYKGVLDNNEIPEIIESDYVPACSVMIRTNVIKKIGLMDEKYFIYWDDINWFYKIKLEKYRVVAYSRSRIWHKMGAANQTNTFATYYFWRNRILFFTKYVDFGELHKFADILIDDAFKAIFFSSYKGQYSLTNSILMAIDDALNNQIGKAKEGRIFNRESLVDRFAEQVIKYQNFFLLEKNAEQSTIDTIVNRIKIINSNAKIFIVAQQQRNENYFKNGVTAIEELPKLNKNDCVITVFNHLVEGIDDSSGNSNIYVDSFFNTAITEEDKKKIISFSTLKDQIKKVYFPILLRKMIELKKIIDI